MDETDLRLLIDRDKRAKNDVLSVYLNVDQTRKDNVNRLFENQLKRMVGSIQETLTDRSELERFCNAARRIEEFVASFRAGARGVVLFFDCADSFFWTKELRILSACRVRNACNAEGYSQRKWTPVGHAAPTPSLPWILLSARSNMLYDRTR